MLTIYIVNMNQSNFNSESHIRYLKYKKKYLASKQVHTGGADLSHENSTELTEALNEIIQLKQIVKDIEHQLELERAENKLSDILDRQIIAVLINMQYSTTDSPTFFENILKTFDDSEVSKKYKTIRLDKYNIINTVLKKCIPPKLYETEQDCFYCKEKFRYERIIKHMDVLCQERPVICLKCNKPFPKSKLKTHFKETH